MSEEQTMIHMIMGGSIEEKDIPIPNRREKVMRICSDSENRALGFGPKDLTRIQGPQTDSLVIRARINEYDVERILVDIGSYVNIIFMGCLEKMGEDVNMDPLNISLFGFTGKAGYFHGRVKMPIILGDYEWKKEKIATFMVIETPSPYNVILGRPALYQFQAVISQAHLIMKFPSENGEGRADGIGEAHGNQRIARKEYVNSVLQAETRPRSGICRSPEDKEVEKLWREGKEPQVVEFEEGELVDIDLTPEQLGHVVRIGSHLPEGLSQELKTILVENMDLFAWKPEDMKGIDPKVAVHRLNIKPNAKPVKQKRRHFAEQQNRVIEDEVERLLKIGHISRYSSLDGLPTWYLYPSLETINDECV